MNTITCPAYDFAGFGKISRASKAYGCVITEKLDGTNAQIVIKDGVIEAVGSRSRWIVPGKSTDNYGFASWVLQHYQDLLTLGDGTHFGEWYGNGIQRGYGLDHKRFALFNADRWTNLAPLPHCCEVVPILYRGEFSPLSMATTMGDLEMHGSYSAPGWDKPEGIVAYLYGPRILIKETFEFSQGKWKENV